MRSVVAMSSNTPEVMVVTSDGSFFLFGIDLSKGGEGTLMKQYSYVSHIPFRGDLTLTDLSPFPECLTPVTGSGHLHWLIDSRGRDRTCIEVFILVGFVQADLRTQRVISSH
jgi:hypothetical protein